MYSWKMVYYNRANADKVGEEIHSLGDQYELKDVVDKARDENTELHKLFEWDDTVAAERFRLRQAGEIVRNLVFEVENKDEETHAPIRVFVCDKETRIYSPTRMIIRQEDEYQKLLDQAYAELQAFKKKYSTLSELDYILELIG